MDLSTACYSLLSNLVDSTWKCCIYFFFTSHIWLWNFSFGIWIVFSPSACRWSGILLPSHLGETLYDASRSATHTIVDSIRNSLGFELDVHDDNVFISAHRNYLQTCDRLFTDLFSVICLKLDPLHAHALQRAKMNDLSGWLSVMPTERDNFDLTAQEFRDALAICYKKPLLSIRPFCDGCGSPSSLDYFLICKKGGLTTQP